jgi:hypothetical protein
MTIPEIRERLLHSDAEFQELVREHAQYSSQLDQLTWATYHDAEDLRQIGRAHV